jgi:hypothetical protein
MNQPEPTVDITENSVVELRRYTLHPGQRDVLIELFEREFIEPQEAVGMSILATFRDDDHPDTFIWLRQFTDMDSRRQALDAFYGGPIWAEHRDAANATMIDSDDVLLLTGVSQPKIARASRSARPARDFEIVTFHLEHDPRGTELTELAQAIGDLDGYTLELHLRSLRSPNTFPALPVRADANVVVAVLATPTTHSSAAPKVDWHEIGSCLSSLTTADTVRLTPTTRSRLS